MNNGWTEVVSTVCTDFECLKWDWDMIQLLAIQTMTPQTLYCSTILYYPVCHS